MKTLTPLRLSLLSLTLLALPRCTFPQDDGAPDDGVTDEGDGVADGDADNDAGTPADPPPPDDAGHDGGADDDAGTVPDAGPGDGPDSGVIETAMTLVARDGHFEREDGTPLDVRAAISCCGGSYGWPLFDDAWVERVGAHGANLLHARLGPFLTTGNGETDWAGVGGGYSEVDGRADLDSFNPAFWARVRALLALARAHGMWVEIDVVDGWAVKHCQAGDIPGYSAWDAAFNTQGVDACTSAGAGAIAEGTVHARWIRKVVAETGVFDNVIYQDGNEVSLVQSYSAEWTRTMHDLIRDEEAARGYVRHPFGTNAGTSAALDLVEVDYLTFHQSEPASAAQCTTTSGARKPCIVNEYNPSPALTPDQFGARLCSARAQGTAFAYWRHGQSEEQMEQSLARLAAPCPEPSTAFPPGVPEEGFIAAAASLQDTDPIVDAAVNATMAALTGCPVGSSCDLSAYPGDDVYQQCQSWFAAVTSSLRAQGFHAGQHEVGHTDEIAVSNTGCAGRWYGYHVCNYGGPLVVWNPGARRGWWQIDPAYCE